MLNASEIVKEIQKRYKIIGRTEELEKIILARLVDKNLIIEGEVGVGKTRIAKAVASYYDTEFSRIDCSEETLPHNLVGYFDPPLVISKGYLEESYVYGPLASSMLKGGCLFINEINRMPESTQNSLLTALDERILEIPKLKTIRAHKKFFVVATQNPAAHVGVTVIGEALKDRFIWISLDFQPPKEEILIIKQEANIDKSEGEKIAQISQQIVDRTRNITSIRRGSSIRGAIDLAQLISKTENSNSTKNWVNTAVMALYNKIELEDGVTSSKKEIIADIVLSVLNKTDFQ
ncbi:MAG: MoxR family ATPase [Candidatus Lokiarchaeota archaeon]|nr:MoxR family ATPase [Candidatus Lokiarchaeota archaeon]